MATIVLRSSLTAPLSIAQVDANFTNLNNEFLLVPHLSTYNSFTATSALKVPAGTTAQRPSTPVSGDIRYNSSTQKFEGYSSAWGLIGGGATGGGTDTIFYENGTTITTNYTVTSGKNASSTGPITTNSGVTVTIPSGSRWIIL